MRPAMTNGSASTTSSSRSQVSGAEPVDRQHRRLRGRCRHRPSITFTVTRAGDSAGAVTADYAVDLRQRPVRRRAPTISPPASRSPARSASPTARPARRSRSTSTATSAPRATRISPSPSPTRAPARPSPTAAPPARSSTTTARRSLVTINDVTVAEGDSGTSLMTFTVTRTGGTGAFDVDLQTAERQRHRGRATMSPTSGTLNFGVGENEPDDQRHDQRRHRSRAQRDVPGPALQRDQLRRDHRRHRHRHDRQRRSDLHPRHPGHVLFQPDPRRRGHHQLQHRLGRHRHRPRDRHRGRQ